MSTGHGSAREVGSLKQAGPDTPRMVNLARGGYQASPMVSPAPSPMPHPTPPPVTPRYRGPIAGAAIASGAHAVQSRSETREGGAEAMADVSQSLVSSRVSDEWPTTLGWQYRGAGLPLQVRSAFGAPSQNSAVRPLSSRPGTAMPSAAAASPRLATNRQRPHSSRPAQATVPPSGWAHNQSSADRPFTTPAGSSRGSPRVMRSGAAAAVGSRPGSATLPVIE